MKKIIAILLLFTSFNLLAQTKVEFYYGGEELVSHQLSYKGFVTKYKEEMVWTTCYQNNRAYSCQKKVRTEYEEWTRLSASVELNFKSESSQVGIGTFFVISVENGKLSINELSGKNIIALGVTTAFERVENGGDITITSKMDVSFKNGSTENIFLPVQQSIGAIDEEDSYLNILVGKVVDPRFFKLVLKVSKKKFWSFDTLIDRRILSEEMDITPYGDNQSLVTIDLEYLLDYLGPGDKYKVEVETKMNMENVHILSKKYAGRNKLSQYKKETLKI